MITLLSNFSFNDLNPAQMIVRSKINFINSVNKLELPIYNEENPNIVIKPHKQRVITVPFLLIQRR